MDTNTQKPAPIAQLVEYRVRPAARFIVTRFWRNEDGSTGSEQKGEYESGNMAYEVAYALCKEEQSRLGWLPDDERIQYPKLGDML